MVDDDYQGSRLSARRKSYGLYVRHNAIDSVLAQFSFLMLAELKSSE